MNKIKEIIEKYQEVVNIEDYVGNVAIVIPPENFYKLGKELQKYMEEREDIAQEEGLLDL